LEKGINIRQLITSPLGPDPLLALQTIDRLNLYDTIFANHQATVDATNWKRVYTAVNAILNDQYKDVDIPSALRGTVRRILVLGQDDGSYYSWMVAALTPWTAVSPDAALKKTPRPAVVARDSLRCDNKLVRILTAAGQHHEEAANLKSSFLRNELGSEAPDIRWNVAKPLRKMGRDWRLCVLQALLLEIMTGVDAAQGRLYTSPAEMGDIGG
jgi:hypothetical protein